MANDAHKRYASPLDAETCANKRTYTSWRLAVIDARMVTDRHRNQDPVAPYICPACRGWHVGTVDRFVKRAGRRWQDREAA